MLTDSPTAEQRPPYSRLSAHLIEANYQALGCDGWDNRRVQLLCAKTGDTPAVLGARMRLRPYEFNRRMRENRWTEQDGLILTFIEREIDFLRGDIVPDRPLFGVALAPTGETNA